MKIGIGIDIDDTLTNLFDVFVSYGFLFAYKNNIDIKELFINGYEALDTFNFTPEQDKLFQTTYLSKILNQVKPRPLASEVINELKNQFDIYIITSRNDELMKDCKINTEKWLKNNNIYYNHLIYDCNNKAEFCENNNIKYLIDDNHKHCLNASRKGIKSFIFDNHFNKDYYNNEIIRVYSWGQILYEINKLEEKRDSI